MSLVKFFKYTCIVTSLALVYIHLQMQIIDLAYQGEIKEKKIKELAERNGNALYKISKLKSANHLGGELLAKNSDMQFVSADHIVSLMTPEEFLAAENFVETQPGLVARKGNPLLSLLSFTAQAEAKIR
jgi:hypothetical protein